MAAGAQRYYLSIDDLARARGSIDELSFQGGAPEHFAAQLQAALREPSLWQRWRAMQPDPDAIDPGLGASDPAATVIASQSDLHCDAQVTTTLPPARLKFRLSLPIRPPRELRAVKAPEQPAGALRDVGGQHGREIGTRTERCAQSLRQRAQQRVQER